ncbi:uncharacterized protein [Arachis hypogaea]|uniref:uncharacterized protein isoform X2 n=1 Tax=Arachis hypogaea TaxID=3818 RepID=UPI003B228B4C
MWKYVNTKFILPDSGEKWVIQAIRDAWKRFKGKIKQKHFVPFDTIEDMVKNRPTQVPESQFIKLIYYWSHPTIQSISEKNKKHKEQQKFPHRMGPINFGRVRVALRATKETNEEPKRFEMFLATRTSRKRKKLIRKHKMQLMNSKIGKLLVKQMRKLLSLYLEKNNQVGLGAMEDLLHDVT